MYEGGSVRKLSSTQIFRFAGLFVPAVLIIYGTLIQSNVISSTHKIDDFGLLVFSFWWLYISVIQFLFPIKTRLDATLRIIAYHLLSAAYLIFITGVNTPIVIFWLLLILASYLYFNKKGLVISLLSLIFVILIDIALWQQLNKLTLIDDLVLLIGIIVSAIVIIITNQEQGVSQKELEKSKAHESLQKDRVTTIINNLADAVISTDVKGVIKIYNAASLSLLDTNNSLNGHYIDDILPLLDMDGNKVSLFEEFKKARTVSKRDDLDFVFEGDDKIRLEITFSPIRSTYNQSKKTETNDGYILIMRDITKAKSLEEERDEFISVISHELRTPITIAEGTISNVQLMMEHPDSTKSMLKDAINTAHEQVIFLAGMVNDLSTLSRAERGVADNAEEIDLKELAHALLNKYSADAKAKNIHLDLDLSPKLEKVFASRLYLDELLQDFITNAIKYTQKGSVTIGIKQKSNDDILFSIKDTGIGVSKSDQQKIFNKFYRSEDYRTRESGGTGLGLYIAAKLSRKLGTKIMLTSRLNFGSTFSFTLPSHKKS